MKEDETDLMSLKLTSEGVWSRTGKESGLEAFARSRNIRASEKEREEEQCQNYVTLNLDGKGAQAIDFAV